MTEKIKAPIWFWIVSVLLLLWNGTGVFNYLNQVTMSEEALAALDEQMKTMIESRPLWATSAFAIAVWSGFIGSVLLLMRKSIANAFFLLSLLGIIINMIAGFFVSDAVASGAQAAFASVIVIVGIIPVWVTMRARGKSWIN